MEVILLERVEKLGNVGDVVKVKSGYGRNYLIPQEKAIRATKDNIAYFEEKRGEIEKQNNDRKTEAEQKAKKLDGIFVVLLMQAGEDGRLFGSVNARNVAGAIADADIDVSYKEVTIDTPIKYLGVHPVRIILHPEVVVTVNVNVARTQTEAKEAEKEFLNPTPKEEDKPQAEEVVAAPAVEEEAKTEEAPESSTEA